MALDPRLLDHVLRAPRGVDVGNTPVVTATVLDDPANAATLVPYLDDPDSTAAVHARQILCRFKASAVPFLMQGLAEGGRSVDGRASGLEVLWALLLDQRPGDVRSALRAVAVEARVLLDDRRRLPDRMPEFVERDFRPGRVCDRAYLVMFHLASRDADLSLFRAADDAGRDREIRRLERQLFVGA